MRVRYDVISHHFLRRRARLRMEREEDRLVREEGLGLAEARALLRVLPARRGPWRWYVVKLPS